MKEEVKKIERMKELEDIFKKAIEQDVLSTSVNDVIINKEDINKIKSLFKTLEQERDGLKANIKEILRMEKISLSNVPLWLLTKLEALIK